MSLKKVTNISILVGMIGGLGSSCATKPRPPKSKLVQRNVAKAPVGRAPIVPKAGAKVMDSKKEAADQTKLSLYEKLYVEGYRLSSNELDTVQYMAQDKEKSALEKAILILAALEHRLIDEGESSRQLEQRLGQVDIDFNQEIAQNPYLQPITVTDRVLKYFQASQDTPEFKRNFIATLQNRANSWNQLYRVSNAESNTGEIENDITNRDRVAEKKTVAERTTNYRAADMQMGDSILNKARSLAQKGNYKAAIQTAESVGPDSPFYPEAQDQIKAFSNQAVQGLRQKAAEAFQSSLPVVDSQTKAAYLSEAKKYLEQALQDYPDADHIQTVQDNLAVITRDLNSISQR